MLRSRLNLSVLVGRPSTQVLASITAILLGSAILAALPVASGLDAHRAVQLTSGGKFAARIPGAAPEPEPAAEETRTTLASGAAGALHPAFDMGLVPLLASDAPATGDGTAAPSLDRPMRGKARSARPGLLRRAADVTPLPLARPAVLVETASVLPDEGVLPKLVSSARSLWSFSASAGSAFFSRLVP